MLFSLQPHLIPCALAIPCLHVRSSQDKANAFVSRNDEKTAADYQLEGGATLHLVLALRGGY
jgi:hypothetical protein